MKILSKALWCFLCVVIFFSVFGLSAFSKFTSLMGLSGASYTLQGEALQENTHITDFTKEVIYIDYITSDAIIETRAIVLYKPIDAVEALPLVFVPHYAVEENSSDFQSYLAQGWAVASPTEFINDYNSQLATNDLVFNNAALYNLRNLDGIDNQRIAIVGGSAGGYMALMLSQLQMGTCATIANSPITNLYYNFGVHFLTCDEVNRTSGAFNFPIIVQGMVSKMFTANNATFADENDPRWAALSPIGLARCVSNPIVINHYTGDILVPVDQITKEYTYSTHDGTLPEEFPVRMADNYPNILSYSLAELATPQELLVQKIIVENNVVLMEMPYSDKLLSINIFDDGMMSAKGSHTAPGTSGYIGTIEYLTEMFSRTLAETERLVPEKLLLLLERYQGNSIQLIAHKNIDDNIYGSLAIYKQEIIDSFNNYINNHSIEELEHFILLAISDNTEEKQLNIIWNEIKASLENQDER